MNPIFPQPHTARVEPVFSLRRHQIVCAAVLLLFPLTSRGGSAAWKAAPSSGNWNTASNWTPATIPNGLSDTATFNASNRTSISLSQNTDLNGIVFSGSASAYFITAGANRILYFGGSGIANNSGGDQVFSATVNGMGDSGSITFANSAMAGLCSFYLDGGTVSGRGGGTITFFNTASASLGTYYSYGGAVNGAYGGAIYLTDNSVGGGAFYNYGGAVSGAYGAETRLQNSAQAGGFFTNYGGAVAGAYGGRTWFFGSAKAGSASFFNDCTAGAGAGLTSFANNSSAENALFANEGGAASGESGGGTYFNDNTSAGSATFLNGPGATNGAFGGGTYFYGNSTAANGQFTNDADPGSGAGNTNFYENTTAGAAQFTNFGGEGVAEFGGYTIFSNSTTANNGTFQNYGGTQSGAYGGHATFNDTATAGNGTFYNHPAITSNAFGGYTEFLGNSSAGNGMFNNIGGTAIDRYGGNTNFFGNSTAGNATLMADGSVVGSGGAIFLNDESSGGTACVKVFGNGFLAVDSHGSTNVAVGSIEGSGGVYVGAKNLTVGANNLSTSFSGFVTESGLGGALSKIGSGVLTFENRAGNGYLGDTLVLSIANNSTINLNYSGTPDTIRSLVVNGIPRAPGIYGSAASGAPNQLSQFAGLGRVQVTTFAVSRKMQGANSYDINLPLAGPSGVECRSGGGGNNYQIVVTFIGNVNYGSVALTAGVGSVSSVTGNNTSTVTINLSGITTPQKIVVTISSLNDGFATTNLAIPMRVIVGDTNGSGGVTATDVSQTKLQSGQPISSSNFRQDVNANGTLNATDVSQVKLRSGDGIAP